MDNAALIELARNRIPCRSAAREIGAVLPAEDDALDRFVEELIAAREALPFTNILLGAVAAGRRVDARHLVEGARLFMDAPHLVAVAPYLHGDVAGALVRACEEEYLSFGRQAAALVVAAMWCGAAPERPIPKALPRLARVAARECMDDLMTLALLSILPEYVPDPALAQVIAEIVLPETRELGKILRDAHLAITFKEPLGDLPLHPPPLEHTGSTRKRTGAKVRRNDPCPCGSGRKYKHCCLERDQQKERAEAYAAMVHARAPDQTAASGPLTADRLDRMRSYELERLDPDAVPPELRSRFILKMAVCQELELMVRHLEHWGAASIREVDWEMALFECGRANRTDLMSRLIDLVGEPHQEDFEIPLFARTVLAAEDPQALLELIEEVWGKVFRTEQPDPDTWVDAAEAVHALLFTRHAELGMALAQGLITQVSWLEGGELVEALRLTRDKLGLPPFEPMEDVLDRFLSAPPEAKVEESIEVEETRQALAESARETDRLHRELAEAQHELHRQEKLRARAEKRSAAPQTSPSEDEASPPPAELAELRRRLNSLKSNLKLRQQERSDLRRQLEAERRKVAELEAEQRQTPAAPAGETEAPDLLPIETEGPQPVRLPEFPADWPGAISNLPPAVVRAAVVLTGRLAAGEAAAFRGVKRLRRDRDLLRQKVGRDHRLLFRLTPDRLRVIELLNRRDFETRLKALT